MFKNLTKETIKEHLSEAVSVIYFPLTLVYLEIALKIKASPDTVTFWLPALLFSAALGLAMGTACLMIKNKCARLSPARRFLPCAFISP